MFKDFSLFFKKYSEDIFIDGEPNKGYWSNLSKNKSFLYKAINEYVYISGQNNFRFHGDFSMGNLIFNKSNTYIIDWEHSNDEIKIWGIDILNIFFESLFFSFKKKDYLSKKTKRLPLKFINIY